jgi:hypothetical protein
LCDGVDGDAIPLTTEEVEEKDELNDTLNKLREQFKRFGNRSYSPEESALSMEHHRSKIIEMDTDFIMRWHVSECSYSLLPCGKLVDGSIQILPPKGHTSFSWGEVNRNNTVIPCGHCKYSWQSCRNDFPSTKLLAIIRHVREIETTDCFRRNLLRHQVSCELFVVAVSFL